MIDGPFWTLAVEWQYYMLLPFLALAFRWGAQRGSPQRRLFHGYILSARYDSLGHYHALLGALLCRLSS